MLLLVVAPLRIPVLVYIQSDYTVLVGAACWRQDNHGVTYYMFCVSEQSVTQKLCQTLVSLKEIHRIIAALALRHPATHCSMYHIICQPFWQHRVHAV